MTECVTGDFMIVIEVYIVNSSAESREGSGQPPLLNWATLLVRHALFLNCIPLFFV